MGLATKQQSPTLNINKRRSFGVISEPAHDRWITLDSFHHGPDNLFFDQNTPLTLDMHWPSLHAVYWPRAYRMPHLPAVARHTASPAIKKPTSRQSKYSHTQGIYQLFSHHPKVAGTIELWNGPLKTHERTVLCRAGWDKVFHKATHTPNQRCSFLKARLHRSRSQGWEREWHHSSQPVVTHLQNLLLLPVAFALLAKKSCCQKGKCFHWKAEQQLH